MIKLTQVKTSLGSAVLVFSVDFPDATVRTVEVDASDVVDRLKKVKSLLGRSLTVDDLKAVIKQVIAELRQGQKPLMEKWSYADFVGVDLEV